jgi:hypothetical protein
MFFRAPSLGPDNDGKSFTVNLMLSREDSRPGPHFFSRKLEDYHGKIPFIISDLVAQLDNLDACHKEGIFRLSAPKNSVDSFCRLLDQGRVTDWTDYGDHNLIACTLKASVRELSIVDPLIGADIGEDVKTTAKAGAADATSRISALVESCPVSRRNALSYVMQYLRKIADASDVNLMTPYNISVCWSPIMFPRSALSVASDEAVTAVEMMVDKFTSIFKPEWCSEKVVMSQEEFERMAEPEIDIADALNEQARRANRKNSLIPYDREELPYALQLARPTRPAPKLPGK